MEEDRQLTNTDTNYEDGKGGSFSLLDIGLVYYPYEGAELKLKWTRVSKMRLGKKSNRLILYTPNQRVVFYMKDHDELNRIHRDISSRVRRAKHLPNKPQGDKDDPNTIHFEDVPDPTETSHTEIDEPFTNHNQTMIDKIDGEPVEPNHVAAIHAPLPTAALATIEQARDQQPANADENQFVVTARTVAVPEQQPGEPQTSTNIKPPVEHSSAMHRVEPAKVNPSFDLEAAGPDWHVSADGVARHDPPHMGRHGTLCCCCCCCCDMRRAVISINIALLLVTLIGFFVTPFIPEDDESEEQDVQEIWDDYYQATIVVDVIDMLVSFAALYGAYAYHSSLLIFSALWHIVAYILFVSLDVTYRQKAEDAAIDWDDEDYLSRTSAILAYILMAFLHAAIIYPHVMLSNQIREGIMSERTFAREDYCSFWSGTIPLTALGIVVIFILIAYMLNA